MHLHSIPYPAVAWFKYSHIVFSLAWLCVQPRVSAGSLLQVHSSFKPHLSVQCPYRTPFACLSRTSETGGAFHTIFPIRWGQHAISTPLAWCLYPSLGVAWDQDWHSFTEYPELWCPRFYLNWSILFRIQASTFFPLAIWQSDRTVAFGNHSSYSIMLSPWLLFFLWRERQSKESILRLWNGGN